ncbi:unnamed protein product, partial [Bemisia tabaci]
FFSEFERNDAISNPASYLLPLWEVFFLWGAFSFLPALARDIVSGHSEMFSLKNQDAMIDHINQVQSSWTAGKNFPDDISQDYLRQLASAWLPEENDLPSLPVLNALDDPIHTGAADPPAEFDARKKWTKCPSLLHIYDQGNCGSCWAVAAASVITDRTCIASNGAFKDYISGWNLVCCCIGECSKSCGGGFTSKAFEFHVKQGIVTGGEFGTNQGCMPYQIKHCSHHMGDKGKYPNCKSYNETVVPVCVNACTNKGYKTPMSKDRHFGKRAYQVTVADLKKELVEKGPVTMSFKIYEDFYLYKTGVYHHVTGEKIGGHAVRVLGYGTEKGESYWLVANSWNSEWGDQGLFKIRSGTNDCNSEENFQTSEPKV